MSGAYFLHTLEVLADPFKQKTICLRPSSSTLLQTFGVSLGICQLGNESDYLIHLFRTNRTPITIPWLFASTVPCKKSTL